MLTQPKNLAICGLRFAPELGNHLASLCQKNTSTIDPALLAKKYM